MAHSHIGSGSKKQNNSGQVESKQGTFPELGSGFSLVLGAQAEEMGMVVLGKARKQRVKL